MNIKEIINNLNLISSVIPDYSEGRNRGLSDDESEKIAFEAISEAIEILERGNFTMNNIEDLRVFEFECGESDWVIAKDEKEAKKYYATIIDDINEYEITELKDWHNEPITVETIDKQSDGTHYKKSTLLEVAKELYSNGYNEPEVIMTTCF